MYFTANSTNSSTYILFIAQYSPEFCSKMLELVALSIITNHPNPLIIFIDSDINNFSKKSYLYTYIYMDEIFINCKEF